MGFGRQGLASLSFASTPIGACIVHISEIGKRQISRCLKMDSIFKNIDPWSYS